MPAGGGLPGQYGGMAGHPWHHIYGFGPVPLLRLALPFLFLAVVFAALSVMRSARRWTDSMLTRLRSPRVSLPAVARNTHASLPVLASDREREEAARLVSHAVGEARLSFEEGGERIDAVLRSRHRHELDDLIADLPADVRVAPSEPPPSVVRRRLLVGAALVVLGAVVVQATAGLWELWPLAVLALSASALLPRR